MPTIAFEGVWPGLRVVSGVEGGNGAGWSPRRIECPSAPIVLNPRFLLKYADLADASYLGRTRAGV